MKIKLPNFRLGRGPTAGPSLLGPQVTSTGTLTSEPVVLGAAGDRMRLWSRRLRGAAGYVFLFIVVFFVFVWISLPTRAIAWRIGQEAREAGYVIEIEDMSISPFGGITLYNVTWTFQPSHSGQIPRKLQLPEVAVDVGVFSLLLGNYDVEVDTNIDDATIHAAYTRSSDESTVTIHVADLQLYDVPKLQQSVNAPLQGLFALDVDLTMPENQFSKAAGSIRLQCAGCKIGDGTTPLFIPGASGIMAKGVTLPEIDLGSLNGNLVVADGKANAEQFETQSDDLTLKISGGMTLADPFSKSEFGFDLKLLITPTLQDRSEPLKLMVQTAGPATKLDPPEQEWLGFKLRGSAGKPKFMGIKTKSKEERDRERRQAALERDAKRKAAKAKRDRADKDKKTPTGEEPTGGGMAAPTQEPGGAEPAADDTKQADARDEGGEPRPGEAKIGEGMVLPGVGSDDAANERPGNERPEDRPQANPANERPEDTRAEEAPQERPEAGGQGADGGGGAQEGGAPQEGGAQEGSAPQEGGAPQGEAGQDGAPQGEAG